MIIYSPANHIEHGHRRRSERHEKTPAINYLSRMQLGEIDLRLSDSDRELLRTLKRLRYLQTKQIQRLFFDNKDKTLSANLTLTARTLNRLKKYGLVSHLEKNVSGVKRGSIGLIWHLTSAGLRILDLGSEDDGKRKRANEPSPTFVRHTLAVSECYVQITSICESEPDMSIRELSVEPECWRAYELSAKEISLRPDLFAITVSGEYRDRWFIEMDLDTEALPIVIEKCRRYHQYYRTEKEQTANGVFPAVLWIVPNERRKRTIIEKLNQDLPDNRVRLFLIITPEELHSTLKNGAGKEDLC